MPPVPPNRRLPPSCTPVHPPTRRPPRTGRRPGPASVGAWGRHVDRHGARPRSPARPSWPRAARRAPGTGRAAPGRPRSTPASWWRERTPRMGRRTGGRAGRRVPGGHPRRQAHQQADRGQRAGEGHHPASTVMDIRKLISSIRVYMTSRNVRSLSGRDPPPGRAGCGHCESRACLPLDEPGIAPDNTRRNVHLPT